MLGGQLVKVFGNAGVGWDREDVDATQIKDLRLKIEPLLASLQAIINCVAYNDVDGAEDNRQAAIVLNQSVPAALAGICKELDIPLVHFSTNYVFDGRLGEYAETGEAKPLSVYGQTKLAGEQAVTEICQKYYVVRTSVLFGPKGQSELSKKSFVEIMADFAEAKKEIKVVNDEINSLAYAPDLALAVKELIDDKKPFGVYHIANSGQASWFDFAKEIFSILKKDIQLLPIRSDELKRKARRPKKAVLVNTKLPPLRSWQEALKEFLNQKP